MWITLRVVSGQADEPEGCPRHMILDSESWMDLRRFRALHRAGVSIAEIARETGHD